MIALLLASGPLKPPEIFDASVAAFARLKSYTVHIDVDKSIGAKRDIRTYDVTVNGRKVLVRLRQPATTTVERSDRTFELLDDRLVAYDSIANERLQRPDTIKSTAAVRLSAVLGQLDDELTMALEPGAMKAFFSGFRGFRDWRVSQSNGDVVIVRRASGGQTLFRFGGSTPYLEEVSSKLKGSSLHWKISIRPGGTVALNIPSDARKVSGFSERPAPPKYASAQAEKIVERMMKAYDKLKRGEIEVEDDGVVSRLWLNGLKLREDRKGFEWAYDGSILTALNPAANKFYRGKTIRVTLSEFIVPMGGEVDPMLRRVLAHRTPFGDLFPSEATVSYKGAVSVNGVSSDILKVVGGSTSFSVFVRTDNHLLASVEAETIDKTRHTQTVNVRRYKYLHVGEAPPSTVFTIAPGKAKRLPLPKVKGLN